MRLNEADKITLAECRKRALAYLAKQPPYTKASCVGNAMCHWPHCTPECDKCRAKLKALEE